MALIRREILSLISPNLITDIYKQNVLISIGTLLHSLNTRKTICNRLQTMAKYEMQD
jgi:hypothetical protein